MRPIKPSAKRSRVWRWLGDASHQAADTVEQGFQTSCLLSLSLLNHHHCSQLCDSSHDISPVRAAAYAPPADNESGSKLLSSHSRLTLSFPIIKPNPLCCGVKRHLSCQLGFGDASSGPLFVLLVVSAMWPAEFFMTSISLKELVRRKILTPLWFCCPFKCRSSGAQLSVHSHSLSKLAMRHVRAKETGLLCGPVHHSYCAHCNKTPHV